MRVIDYVSKDVLARLLRYGVTALFGQKACMDEGRSGLKHASLMYLTKKVHGARVSNG